MSRMAAASEIPNQKISMKISDMRKTLEACSLGRRLFSFAASASAVL